MRSLRSMVAASAAPTIRKGMRVTQELRTWHDGSPVLSWPNPHYVGTVLRVDSWHGCTYARVKRDVAKHAEWVNVDRLSIVEAKS